MTPTLIRSTPTCFHAAKHDPGALPDAARALNALDTTDKRHVRASYARLSKAV